MRVLLADDDLLSRMAMSDVLQACGAREVVAVEDGAQAHAELQRDPRFDLVCLDLRMPPPDGLALAEQVRASKMLKRLAVMLITSTSDRNTVLAATRLQIQGFIVKPVGADTAERVGKAMQSFDTSVLEPAQGVMERLNIDAARYGRYLAAFEGQFKALIAKAESHATSEAFRTKLDACRTGALTLGAQRIELLLGDALKLIDETPTQCAPLLGLGLYWFERVRDRRSKAAS